TPSKPSPACCSSRYGLALLSSYGFFVVYSLRVNLSVAMVDMLNNTHQSRSDHSGSVCTPNNTPVQPKHNQSAGVYNWDSATQGWILGSFFYGYILTQIPGGYLAGRCGAKWLMGFGVLGTALFTLLTPLAADLGASYLIVVRALEGVGEGVTFPAMYTMWASWAPPLERSRLLTISYIEIKLSINAPSFIEGYQTPDKTQTMEAFLSRLISKTSLLPHTKKTTQTKFPHCFVSSQLSTSAGHIPWRAIVTSMPLMAIVVAHFSYNWTFYTLLTLLPTYMNDILGFSIQQNGFLSALPYLGCALMAVLSGQVADYLRETRLYSTVFVRKSFSLIGNKHLQAWLQLTIILVIAYSI
uniref:Sialin n=1 Tax=Poecilia mexicana TaxID=48701 RepID=A0A3B3YVY2_9TELE